MKRTETLSFLLSFLISWSAVDAGDYEVSCPDLTVKLSPVGEIIGASLGSKLRDVPLTGSTTLADCRRNGGVAVAKLDDGGVEFRGELIHRLSGRTLRVIERFLPTSDSVRWEIELVSDGKPWSTTIGTLLCYPATAKSRFWTAWSDPEQRSDGWRDPLVLMPFATRSWNYRGERLCDTNISIPLATAAEPEADTGVSLILSPEDTLLNLHLCTRETGEIEFLRTRHRLGGGLPVRFAMDLAAHEADWRGGLRWMVRRYPKYFEPPNPKVAEMAGCGAYSADERPIDVDKFRRMAFRINWKCSEDFPYMGMFLPPVKDENERWLRDREVPTIPGKLPYNTLKSLNDHCRRMRKDGFFILSYFDVVEFGKDVRFPPPPRKAAAEADMWKDPNDYLYAKLADAILMQDGRPIRWWHGSLIMDCGEPCFRRHLLDQARRHIDKQPESFGICIDQLSWLDRYNLDRDDGVSWVDGRPARSLYLSWHGLMSELGPLMHSAGKVIFANSLRPRLELYREVDGFFCEFGDGPSMNASALLGQAKPVLMWTDSEDSLRPDPDAFFQRHLHVGAFPMAPYPGNHHSITPSEYADGLYLDYGPLLDSLRGKRWVLTPRVVEALGRKPAKANVFAVPDGYVVPVTFAGQAATATIVLRGLAGITKKTTFEAVQPGRDGSIPLVPSAEGNSIRLEVPVHRGCAMVRIRNVPENESDSAMMGRQLNCRPNDAGAAAQLPHQLCSAAEQGPPCAASAAPSDAREARAILTPAPPAAPRINGARIFGVRPGNPFLFTIPATGRRPMEFSADDLPEGLHVDPLSGQITGKIDKRGEYTVTLRAKNALGQAARKLRIVCGDTLALTPHMGWSGWYIWAAQVTDKTMRDAADAMVATDLINHGYMYLCIDDAWGRKPGSKGPIFGGPPRDEKGNVLPNGRFPDMKALVDYIHAKGLKAGIYTSPGPLTCAGRTGSYQHEEQDARRFAEWGFDYLKHDWCSYKKLVENPDLDALKAPYQKMGECVRKQNRDIVFNLCQYGMGDVWRWGREIGGHSWRTGGDFGFPLETMSARLYSDVFNLYGRNELQKFSGPGGWNDPDYLLLGYLTDWKGGTVPTPLTPNEQYSHVSLWCLLAAPLIFSCDITRLDDFTLALLSNDEVIEVDQDPLGKAALRLAKRGDSEVWAKDMEDGSKAVGIFNRGETEARVTVKWSDLGIAGKQEVRDLWRQKDLGSFEGQFSTVVGRHGVTLVRLRPAD